MEIESKETLHNGPIEDFNPLELATSEEEYEENYEDLGECVHVMRCTITILTNSEAWKCTSIFHTYA